MTTNHLARPLPLPPSAIPDGCPAWDSPRARHWTEALPPRWTPPRTRARYVWLVTLTAALAAGALSAYADWRPRLAALTAAHAMWLRPTAPAEDRHRGRPLWPLAVLLGVAWAAALALLP
ncbi:hypothetical protein [Streptomyces sp. NPDC001480]|uniref:hypothetical protein n=1 Tax=Streptomyces sp. NPDC001480 TaxID=3364577 RepID=UPI0036BC34E4